MLQELGVPELLVIGAIAVITLLMRWRLPK
jgi:hypothetical protein